MIICNFEHAFCTCIVGNFGEVFNLANWRFCGKSPNLKSANIISCTISHYVEALAITKLKTHQCILMTDLPNLMLAKVSCYMVYATYMYMHAHDERARMLSFF